MVKLNINISKQFKEEVVDPILIPRKIKFPAVIRAVVRKISVRDIEKLVSELKMRPATDKGLSFNIAYDIDYGIRSVSSHYDKIKSAVEEIESCKGLPSKNIINSIIRDELYKFFENYEDVKMIELMSSFGDDSIDDDLITIRFNNKCLDIVLDKRPENIKIRKLLYIASHLITSDIVRQPDSKIMEDIISINKEDVCIVNPDKEYKYNRDNDDITTVTLSKNKISCVIFLAARFSVPLEIFIVALIKYMIRIYGI